MTKRRPGDSAFTAAVKQAQAERGSRDPLEQMAEEELWFDRVTPVLEEFLKARDPGPL